ncbi:MAG: hypothetical protein H3C62_15570, partial [Gemmatimonadaceae bacterium]|nr:hypothetical protein [Gemmatimonadaceae bacterium]
GMQEQMRRRVDELRAGRGAMRPGAGMGPGMGQGLGPAGAGQPGMGARPGQRVPLRQGVRPGAGQPPVPPELP